jgi:type I restriction enzyme M protein
MTELAELAGVGLPAVSNWRSRHRDFPGPCGDAGGERFDADEVAGWLANRKIPQHALTEAERPGTTYGERFTRNRSPSDQRPAAVTPPHAARRPTDNLPVGGLLDAVLGVDGLLSVEVILGTLYVKTHHPQQWASLRGLADTDLSDRLAGLIQMSVPGLDGRLFLSVEVAVAGFRSLRRIYDIVEQWATPPHGDRPAMLRLIDAVLDRVGSVTKSGDLRMPESLARLMAGIAEPTASDRVYDPFARGGELLFAAALAAGRDEGSAPVRLVGDVVAKHDARVARLCAALLGIEVDLRQRWAITARSAEKYDLVLSNPPFNLRMTEAGRSRRWGAAPPHNANFEWLQHAAESLAPGGRAAVLMTDLSTSSENHLEARIRTAMVADGIVDAVVALPAKLFVVTGIPVTLWVLRAPSSTRREEVLLVDATKLGRELSRVQCELTGDEVRRILDEYRRWRDGSRPATVGFSRSVPVAEIVERAGVLSPRQYIEPPDLYASPEQTRAQVRQLRDGLAALRAEAATVQARADARAELFDRAASAADGWSDRVLGEVCDSILAGPGTVERSEPADGTVPLVLPRNFRHNRISEVDLEAVQSAVASSMWRYRLDVGDVVGTRTGELGRYGLVEQGQAGWLLGPGCLRLRPGPDIDSAFLLYQLGTPAARDWLERHATGSAIKSISTKALARMPLILPSLELQRELGAALSAVDAAAAVHDRISLTGTKLREALAQLLIR